MRFLSLSILSFLGALAWHGVSQAGGYQTVDWQELKAEIWGDAEILPGEGMVALDAPFRSANDAEVPLTIRARLAGGEKIAAVSLIIDENPMPVSAVWRFDEAQDEIRLGVNMRLNGPSPVRAVVETEGGARYMVSKHVRTSGLGACSAPPVGDPAEALADLGEMELLDVTDAQSASPINRTARLEVKHPQHTGLQMDQVSLLFILARYIETLEVWNGDERLFTLEGSISLSEDPEIEFELPASGAQTIKVRALDTDGTVIEKDLAFGASS